MSGALFRLGSRCPEQALRLAVRGCASAITGPEQEEPVPFAVAFSNRRLTDSLGLSLEDGCQYVLTFENCTFSPTALGQLEAVVVEYDVRELHLHRGGFPVALVGRFVETVCASNLRHVDLSGIVLDQEHLSILERCLAYAPLSHVHIKVRAECAVEALKEVCKARGVSLTVSVSLPASTAPVNLRRKIELVYIGSWKPEEQGGFNDYKHVKTREEVLLLTATLARGFYFTLIERKNEDEKTLIDTVVFTMASGRGFILPFSRDLEDLAAENTQLIIKSLFENREVKKSCRSCSHCYKLLKNHGITLRQVVFDLSLAVQEWNPLTSLKGMGSLRKRLLGVRVGGRSPEDIVPSREQWEYMVATTEADVDYRMGLQMQQMLAKKGSWAHFKKISLPLEELLCEVTERGVRVSQDFIAAQLAKSKDALDCALQSQKELAAVSIDVDQRAQGLSRMQRRVVMLSDLLRAVDPVLHRIYVHYVQCTPTISMKSSPNIETSFVAHNLASIFLPEGNKKLFFIHFTNIALRVLAQISQDPMLIKLCVTKTAGDVTLDMNRILFKKKCFLDKTSLICMYAIGVLSKAKLTTALGDESQQILERFQQVFPKTVEFHHQMETKVGGARSEFGLKNLQADRGDAVDRLRLKILGTVRDYINLFTIKLHQELERLKLSTTIHSIRRESVIVNIELGEESVISDLAQRISASLVGWSIPIPVKMTEITQVEEKAPPLDEIEWIDAASVSVFDHNIAPHLAPMKIVQEKSARLPQNTGLKNVPWVDVLKNTFVMGQSFLWKKFTHLLWGVQTSRLVYTAVEQDSPSQTHGYEEAAENALQKYFPSVRLRSLQHQVISQVLCRRDAVAVLPTGYGKSVCFQLPAILFEGVCLVVSPLISLIENQLLELSLKQIPSAWLQSSNRVQLLSGRSHYKILYITPETLVSREMLLALQKSRISFFAIDEAHCIHQWGRTFRSSYRDLECIREFFPDIPILALSATATPGVIEDIRSVLGMKNSACVVGSFLKKNLSIHIKQRHAMYPQLVALLERHKNESGVVYCRTREDVDQVHRFLVSKGYAALPYHAKMDSVSKSKVLQAFLSDTCKIVVGTVAFGLGINKSNVRFVCHMKMPDNIEKFYQEIGRAGRDGLPAECLMLFSDGDFIQNRVLNRQIVDSSRSEMNVKTGQMYFFCKHMQCRQLSIARYFGDLNTTEPCQTCDVCRGSAESVDGTEIVQQIIKAIINCYESSSVNYLVRLLCRTNVYALHREHRQLSLMGCLSAYDPRAVRGLINYCIGCGYITMRDKTTSGTERLMCNLLSREILKGGKRIYIQRLPLQAQELPPSAVTKKVKTDKV